MGLKLFSSKYRRGQEGLSQIIEKESGQGRFWILVLLPVSLEKGQDILKQLGTIVESALFSMPESEHWEENFETMLKNVNETLPKIIGDDAENILRMGAILLTYLKSEELLISSFGQGEVFLWRNNSLIEISEGLSPINVDAEYFQNISSGDIQDGDKILLSTFRMQRFLTEKQLAISLEDGVTEAIESITPFIDPGEEGNIVLLSFKATEAPLPFKKEEETKKTVFNSVLDNSLQIGKKILRSQKRIPQRIEKTKIFLSGAIVLTVLLLFLFFFLLSGETTPQESTEYSKFINTIEQQFSTVDTRFAEGKIEQANLILDRIEEKAGEMLVKRVDTTNASRILSIVQEKREYVNQIMRIINPEVMVDFTTVNQDVETRGFVSIENEILTYDQNSLYRVLISGTKAEGLGNIVSGGNELDISTPFPSKETVVFVTKNGNVLEWKERQVVATDTADETWKNAIEIDTFSKFLYFLDPSSEQIWKYERRDSGFTLPEPWLAGETEQIKGAASFTIDGSIFVLTKKGEILKFHRGEKQGYEIKNVPGGELKGDKIFTSEALNFLFVLNISEGRIFILSKFENEAIYKKQIILENTGEIVDFFATENKIFVLGKQKIFEIPFVGE
jgi:hypothetical protein